MFKTFHATIASTLITTLITGMASPAAANSCIDLMAGRTESAASAESGVVKTAPGAKVNDADAPAMMTEKTVAEQKLAELVTGENKTEAEIEQTIKDVVDIEVLGPKKLLAGDELVPQPRNRFLARLKTMRTTVSLAAESAKELARSIRQIRRDVKEEMSRIASDEYLFAFHGFHHNMKDRHYYMRKWSNLSAIGKVSPDDVIGMSPNDFATLAKISMEVEAPTIMYSEQSGQTFLNVFPTIGRYMGRNKNEAELLEDNVQRRVCVSSWCAEESRHAGFFERVIERLTGKPPSRENPNEPDVYGPDEITALKHLGTRQTFEWNAASGYFFMRAQAKGPLRDAMTLILRDEIKHLTIMSAAYTYMFGNRPWTRFNILLKNAVEILKYQKSERSGGEIGNNRLMMFKVAMAHLFTEIEIRRYLRTVPKSTLRDFFDGKSELPPLPSKDMSAADIKSMNEIRDSYRERRGNFHWWPQAQATKMRAQIAFETKYKSGIDEMVSREFNNFKGTELLDAKGQAAMMAKIDDVVVHRTTRYLGASLAGKPVPLREILYERMRDHQIRNNRHEVSKAEADAANPTSTRQTSATAAE